MTTMFKAKLSDRETQVRFARFVVVGLTTLGVQLLTIWLFGRWMVTDAAYLLSFVVATATHYCLNRFWALPSARRDSFRQFREYAGVVMISLVINFLLFRLCIQRFALGRIWATAVAVPPSAMVIFLLLNYRVFRAKAV